MRGAVTFTGEKAVTVTCTLTQIICEDDSVKGRNESVKRRIGMKAKMEIAIREQRRAVHKQSS